MMIFNVCKVFKLKKLFVKSGGGKFQFQGRLWKHFNVCLWRLKTGRPKSVSKSFLS